MNCWIILLLLFCCGNGNGCVSGGCAGNNCGCGNVGGANDDCDCGCHNHKHDCGCNHHHECGCHHHHHDCNKQSDCEAETRNAVKAVWEAKEAKRDAREAVREAKEAVRDAREACDSSMPSLRGNYNYTDYDNDCGCRN